MKASTERPPDNPYAVKSPLTLSDLDASIPTMTLPQ